MNSTTKSRTIHLASYNRHKALEIQAMTGNGLTILALDSNTPKIHWEETGETFEENARIKAWAVHAQVKGPILADDSGLAVQALGGRPGVYSSSFSGREGDDQANTRTLLEAMRLVPSPDRIAAFICCLLFIDEGGKESVFFGECPGKIALIASGLHGFGYDPVFIPDGFDRTFGELGPSVKNSLSHRRIALEKWRESLG
jgi:XTP/dITP diphosphohydrolase